MKKPTYKQIRTTIALALHSRYITTVEDPDLLRALHAARASNYDMERMDAATLEMIYGHFDAGTTRKVLAEFTYHTSLGNVRDNGRPVAICTLCGKGDSRDDGANADHLRYEYRLTNGAGGSHVWCGSTCILNHHLKVAGAETSAEARKLLERSFRLHMKEWARQAWRAENPDHESIVGLYEKVRHSPLRGWSMRQYSVEMGLLLGLSYDDLARRYRVCFGGYGGGGELRTAVRFYLRHAYLTPAKQVAWDLAKSLKRDLAILDAALLEAQGLMGEARLAFFRERGETLKKPHQGAEVFEAPVTKETA